VAHARSRVQHAWGEWWNHACRARALQWRIRAAQAAQIGPRAPDGLNKAQHARYRDKKHADEAQPVAWAGFSLPAAPTPTLTGTPTAFQRRRLERVQQAVPRKAGSAGLRAASAARALNVKAHRHKQALGARGDAPNPRKHRLRGRCRQPAGCDGERPYAFSSEPAEVDLGGFCWV